MAWMTTKHLKKFAEDFSAKAMSIFAKKTDIPKTLPADGAFDAFACLQLVLSEADE